MIRVDNLYAHADGGFYCLLSDDSALKEPTTVGLWWDAVIYIGPDQKMRSTTKQRWDERFVRVPEIDESELSEEDLNMVRRANPGERDFDFTRVIAGWQESELAATGNMLELAVAATILKMYDKLCPSEVSHQSLTITTEDLQQVLQNYEIERVPQENGFTFQMRKA